jgi:hypothetical protein
VILFFTADNYGILCFKYTHAHTHMILTHMGIKGQNQKYFASVWTIYVLYANTPVNQYLRTIEAAISEVLLLEILKILCTTDPKIL